MRRKTQLNRCLLGRVRLYSPTPLIALGLLAALLGAGCAPDIPNQPRPQFVELQFDPSATPAKSYEPTSLIVDPSSKLKLLDFSLAGIDVPGVPKDEAQSVDPTACQGQTAMSVAQCEFYQYLERLDGFPTLTPGKTPVSKPLKLSTVTLPKNLFIYDINHTKTFTDVDVSFNSGTNSLVFDPKLGWDVDGLYAVGIRGYHNGIEGADGHEAVASVIYALLKQARSLTCGAAPNAGVEPTCDFYSLFSSDPSLSKLPPDKMHAAIGESLSQLEQLRQLYRGENPGMPVNLWDTLARKGNMPKDEVAIAWLFQTHTASVVELDPSRGMTPLIISSSEIRLKLKGSLNADTMSAFSLDNMGGTFFLLDVDKLEVNATDPQALPRFTPTYADGDIVLTATDPNNGFIEGDTYAILLTNEVTDTGGKPLVPSPVTVLLRSRGELVDNNGISQVDGISDSEAQQLEDGRVQFKDLLDDPLIVAVTKSATRPNGLTREMLAYLFGFPFETPK